MTAEGGTGANSHPDLRAAQRLADGCPKTWAAWQEPISGLAKWAAVRASLPQEVVEAFATEFFDDLFESRTQVFGRYQGNARLLTYLRTRASNEARRRAENRKARLKGEVTTSPTDLDQTRARAARTAQNLQESRTALRQYILGLPPGQREVVNLVYEEGLSYAELGSKLGITPDAARMRFVRATSKLRRRWQRQGSRGT
jgi:RNA polymerase sigma factor (sigma-70 family)